jgi:hypothetical protein
MEGDCATYFSSRWVQLTTSAKSTNISTHAPEQIWGLRLFRSPHIALGWCPCYALSISSRIPPAPSFDLCHHCHPTSPQDEAICFHPLVKSAVLFLFHNSGILLFSANLEEKVRSYCFLSRLLFGA